MQPETVIVIVLGIGIAISLAEMIRRRSDSPWADHSPLAEAPDEVEVMGRTLFVEHLHETTHRAIGSGPPRTTYGVALPTALGTVGLIDPEGKRRFCETTRYEQISTSGPPETSDGLFDATFLTVTENHEPGSLRHPEVRAALLEVRDTCQGLWVRDGKLFIIESGPYSESAAEITGEYLGGILERIESVLDE